MKKKNTAAIGLWAVLASLFLWISPHPLGAASAQTDISDKDLKAFVKAYVQVQRIRSRYEPVLNKAKDPKESERIQQEANTKIKTVLNKEGLPVDKYNKIYAAVNSDAALRQKTLKLVEQERKKS